MINGGIINAYGTNARLGAGDWMVVEADESDGTFTRLPATIADRHQHRSRASRLLRRLRRAAAGLRELRRQHPVLRLRRAVHRPSGRAGHDPAPVGAAHRDLRPQPAGRYPRGQHPASAATAARYDVVVTDRAHRHEPHDRATCSCRCSASTTCRTRWPRSPSPRRWGSTTTVVRASLAQFQGREAPLHQDRRVERRHGHRRLRPSPGRDRRRAEGRARRSPPAGSSPSCSRIATRASPICSTSSAPASTMPTR